MNNQELESVLKSALVPERPKEYWEDFPGRVRLAIQQHANTSSEGTHHAQGYKTDRETNKPRHVRLSYALGFGFGLACVAVLIYHFSRTEQPLLTRDQVALAAKVFREIQPLFPNQIREIAFDGRGAHLVLADQPDVPTSQPFFVKFCEGNRCRNFITFSGQEIRLDGQTFQVLVDRHGAVMVMGERWVWSSSTPGEKTGRYRIAAAPLPTTS